MKLYFEEEASFKRGIKVAFQVGGSYQDPFKLLHFLEQDILHDIFGPGRGGGHLLHPPGEDGIGFVEKQDGCPFTFPCIAFIVGEKTFDNLFAFPEPHGFGLAYFHFHQFPAGLPGHLPDNFRLARSRSSVQQYGHAFGEVFLRQPLLCLTEFLLGKQIPQQGELLHLGFFEYQFPERDPGGMDDVVSFLVFDEHVQAVFLQQAFGLISEFDFNIVEEVPLCSFY